VCEFSRRGAKNIGVKLKEVGTYIIRWVNFGGSCNGRRWYILWPLGLLDGHLVYIIYGELVYFRSFWYAVPRKSGNPELKVCLLGK
jgi:hypothetical protein